MGSDAQSGTSARSKRMPRFYESRFRIVTIVYRSRASVTRTFKDYTTFGAVERWIDRASGSRAKVEDDGPRTFHMIVVNSDMIDRDRAERLHQDVKDPDDEPYGVDNVLDDDLLEDMKPPDEDPTYDWDLEENVQARTSSFAAQWRSDEMIDIFKRLGVYDGSVSGLPIWIRRGPRELVHKPGSRAQNTTWAWRGELSDSACVDFASVYDTASRTTIGLIRVSSRDFNIVESVLKSMSALSSPHLLDNPTTWLAYAFERATLDLNRITYANGKEIIAARGNIGTGNPYHYYLLNERKEAIAHDPEKLKDLSKDVLRLSESIASYSVTTQAWVRIINTCRAESERFVNMTATRERDANPNADVAMALEEIWEWTHDLLLHLHDKTKSQQWECDVLQQATQAIIAQLNQEQSARVASASWREATSATTITIIALVFLPGTFTSTLFSMPWFAETVRGGDLEFQRNLYLGLTISLTIVVISLWYLWTTYRGADGVLVESISEDADSKVEGQNENDTISSISMEKTWNGLRRRLLSRNQARSRHRANAKEDV
ncbi:hypothetical protein B0T14DRAFT_530938 [Immersiella caudata]|uniref:Uncharacterized protein n=1 Tax=Immersiella caudata TaxID=314043 RepID=A0AA39TYC3_9PEZI|nr:hypothetical protein B0T14DRAFT_530938 [Immersiella caudata]